MLMLREQCSFHRRLVNILHSGRMLGPLVLCILVFAGFSSGIELKEAFAWKNLDFEWSSNESKIEALKSGAFIPENNIPLSIALWKDKMFIAVPRFKLGVPSTLNYVTIGSESSSPLKPYPSWTENTLPVMEESDAKTDGNSENSSHIKTNETFKQLVEDNVLVSVFRLWVDKCDRLWVMDVGRIDIMESPKTLIRSSLIIYDLNTDTLLRRYFIDSHYKEKSFSGNIIVDVEPDSCENAFAYIADYDGYKLIVYDFKQNASWKIKHHYFYFDPLRGQFNINNVTWQWKDGIFGLALSKKDSDDSRKLFFHSMSSYREFEVSNRLLQNETWATNKNSFSDFKYLGEKGEDSQSSASYFHENSETLFYTQVNRNGLGCWNTKHPLTPENAILLTNDSVKLEFPNDIEVDKDDAMWILSNKLSRFIYQSLDLDEVNFRILTVPIKDTLEICQKQEEIRAG